MTSTSETPGYAESIAELDTILAELEGDDLDVDHLAARVQRAAELIELCRARIERARTDVDRVVKTLADDESEV